MPALDTLDALLKRQQGGDTALDATDDEATSPADGGDSELLALAAAIRGVESGGKTEVVSPQGATGSMQIMPGTFKDYAAPGERYDNDRDRSRAALRKLADDYRHYGGDLRKTAAAYIGGRGGVLADGTLRDDRADAHGTTPRAYADMVLGRMGRQGRFDTAAAAGATAPVQDQSHAATLDEILAAGMAAKPAKAPPAEKGDFVRGVKESFQQLPQLGYGLLAGAGATAESVVGEGGLASGIKKAGIQGYQQWGEKIAANAKDSDSFTYAYEQAKQGDLGALVDWLQHGIGYAGGQGIQMLATAGIGAAVGKAGLKVAAEKLASGMVAKESARIAASQGGARLAAADLTRQATANVAAKIGQTAAIGASALGMEGGEIYGDLAASNPDRALSGAELAKAFGATLAAGGLEFVGDKVGLDLMLGKSRLLRPAAGMPGMAGRAARAGLGAVAAAPIEGATEFGQTLIEEAGKSKDPFTGEALHQATDAAALGTLGGAVMGGAGGLASSPEQAQPQAAPGAPVAGQNLPATPATPPAPPPLPPNAGPLQRANHAAASAQAAPLAPGLDPNTAEAAQQQRRADAAAAFGSEDPAVVRATAQAEVRRRIDAANGFDKTPPPQGAAAPGADSSALTPDPVLDNPEVIANRMAADAAREAYYERHLGAVNDLEAEQYEAGIPTLTDEIPNRSGLPGAAQNGAPQVWHHGSDEGRIPVLTDKVPPQVWRNGTDENRIPVLKDVLAPADGYPVLDDVIAPGRQKAPPPMPPALVPLAEQAQNGTAFWKALNKAKVPTGQRAPLMDAFKALKKGRKSAATQGAADAVPPTAEAGHGQPAGQPDAGPGAAAPDGQPGTAGAVPAVDAEAVPRALKGTPAARKVEPSDQDRSHAEWAANYDRVSITDDLSTVSTLDLERADAYAQRRKTSEQRKGWDGGAVHQNFVRALQSEQDRIKAEVAKRRHAAERATSPAPEPSPADNLAGHQIDKEWTAFAPDSGTLDIPRAAMPQVKAEHRGALVNFLNARDISHQEQEVLPSTLKPTQREFSNAKVQQAKDYQGGDRAILVSSDNHVLDGHHQWLAKLDNDEPVRVIRLDAPIRELLDVVPQFPSAEVAEGAKAPAEPLQATAADRGRGNDEQAQVSQTASTAVKLSLGKLPNSAEPITVRDGVIHIGDYPAQDFDSGADVTVPQDATPQQIKDALAIAGAIGRGNKIFGMPKDEVKPLRAPVAETTPQAAPAAPAEAPAPAVDALDVELQDALGHLGDVLGDVFGAKLNATGQQHGAGDLLPALSKVIELLVRKGFRTFAAAVGASAKAMRGNAAVAQHLDKVSARQWKAAYNAIAEFHDGTDSEEAVAAMGADAVLRLVAMPAVPPADTTTQAPATVILKTADTGDMLNAEDGTLYRIEGIDIGQNKIRTTSNPDMLSERVVLMDQDRYNGLVEEDAAVREAAVQAAQKSRATPRMVAAELVTPEPPATDDRANAELLAKIAANGGNPVNIDGEFMPGVYGTAEQPLKFVSGMSAPGDYTKLFSNGKNVGISMLELSKVSIPRIAEQLAAARGAYLFVDSGAFSIFMRNIREQGAAEREQREVAEAAKLDHDALIQRYEDLSRAISQASGGDANGRAFFVMPDIVGDQAGSLDLVAKYADAINGYGLQAIIPLQGGELSLTEAYEQMMTHLGLDPANDISPILGIPSQAEAVSNDEFTALLRKYGDNIGAVHILGAVSDARLQPRLDAIIAADYDGNVSADANRLRALISANRPRPAAMKHIIQSDMADGSPTPRVVRDDQRPDPVEKISPLEARARAAETVEVAEKPATASARAEVIADGPTEARQQEAALKVLASSYFEVKDRTYKAEPTRGGAAIWASEVFAEGEQPPAGRFGKALFTFVERNDQMWAVDPVGDGKVRLTQVTLVEQPPARTADSGAKAVDQPAPEPELTTQELNRLSIKDMTNAQLLRAHKELPKRAEPVAKEMKRRGLTGEVDTLTDMPGPRVVVNALSRARLLVEDAGLAVMYEKEGRIKVKLPDYEYSNVIITREGDKWRAEGRSLGQTGLVSLEEAITWAKDKMSAMAAEDAAPKTRPAAPKPAARPAKAGADPVLRGDWGVDYIDGYTAIPGGKNEQTDYGLRGGVKDAFLKDASAYLKAVAKVLEAEGFAPHADRKGKPGKVVTVNEGGPAVAGDAMLTMFHPDLKRGIYITVGGHAVGFTASSKSGVTVMMRVTKEGDRYGGGENLWMPAGLPASKLAERARAAVAQAAGVKAENSAASRDNAQEPTKATDDGQSQQGMAQADPAGVPAAAPQRRDDPQQGNAQAHPGDLGAGQSAPLGRPAASGAGEPAGVRTPAAHVEPAAGPDAGRNAGDGRARDGGARNPDAGTGGNGAVRGAAPTVKAPATVSPANTGPGDFHIADPLRIVGGGQVARFDKNRAALELRNQLLDAGRAPTREEQEIIAGYTGWGSFGQDLFQGSWQRPAPKAGWEARDTWLRDNLGQAEWEGMQRSIINAHYTDPPTVLAMWDMVRRMGFTGGRVLEPSIGIGNFYGMMPLELASRSQRAGIELDPVTGSMAQLLYPNANIQIKGYEHSKTPDNFYDLVIGNWPFANISPADRRYNRLSPSLHDYFYLKALDQTRPGGLVVGITSAFTMDKKDLAVRAEIARKGELVAAFRLPSGAFKEYAGTEVVTDIIILRKRAEPAGIVADDGWITTQPHATQEGTEVNVNEYYHANPSHVIGTIDFGKGTSMYSSGSMVVHRPDNMLEHLRRIVDLVPEGAYQADTRGKQVSYVANHTGERSGALTKTADGLFIVRGEHLAPAGEVAKYAVKDPKTTAKREAQLEALIDMRRLYGALIEAERKGDADTERAALRGAYEAYRKEHKGYSDSFGLDYLRKIDDPFYPALAALEMTVDNGDGTRSERPAAILNESTIRGARKMANPTVADAFVLARNDSVNPSPAQIAEMAGVDEATVRRELIDAGAAFETPAGDFIPSDMYLAGNVREKLRQARAGLEEGNEAMQRNIDALMNVIPADVPYYKIETQMGATWVPPQVYADFVAHMLGLPDTKDIEAGFQAGSWKISFPSAFNHRVEASSGFGIGHVPFKRLVRAAIANQTINVKHKDPDTGSEYIDDKATKETNDKIADMRLKFGEWLWAEPVRRVELEREYNEVRNSFADARYDGSFLSFQGMALSLGRGPFNLRQHQVNAIWRALVTKKSLNAHEVGTGKTFTMGGIAVESRRYGIAKKPLMFAHNANSKSVAAEIQMMYPAAKILYVDNLSKENIKVRMAQIANDDWDLIVVPHSLIDRIGFKEDTLMAMAQDDINDLEIAAQDAAAEDNVAIEPNMWEDEEELKKLRSPTAKQLVKQRMRILETIRKLSQQASREDSVAFEDMGIDMILVDEAHEFKKPPIATKMKMKGLQTQVSNRSIAMSFITKYVRGMNNGGNVHLFTGTPITNTMTEVFHMMRYMMNEEMKASGLADWDGWFGSFAREVNDVELSSTGEYEAVTRLQAFINVPELRRMIGQYMDVVFSDDMPEMRPRSVNGKTMADKTLTADERAELLEGRTENAQDRPYKKVVNQSADMSPEQMAVFQRVQALARTWRGMSKKARKEAMSNGAPEVPIIHDGWAEKASFDVRLVNAIDNAGKEGTPEMEPHPGSKPARVVKNLIDIYRGSPVANQVVFLEQGMHKSVTRSEGPKGMKRPVNYPAFSTMHDMVARLVDAGIPREQIAMVTGSTSKDARKAIADAMNSGKIRIVFGSTDSLGVGVNMQRNLRAMHHMDAPWMPGELEQRNGRGHRQGNQWNTVMEYRYLTDRLDGRRWQVLSIKQRFITEFMKSKGDVRVIEGDAAADEQSDLVSTFADAAGDPRVLVREKLKKRLEQLNSRERMHSQAQADAAGMIRRLKQKIERERARLPELQAAAQAAGALLDTQRGETFRMTLDGQAFDKRSEAGDFVADKLATMLRAGDDIEIGQYGGVPLYARWLKFANRPDLYMDVAGETVESNGPSLQSLESQLRWLRDERARTMAREVEEDERAVGHNETVLREPFHLGDKLAAAKKQLDDLERDIEMNPVAPPYWLRTGAPADTTVFWQGKEFVVTGHRFSKDGWFVLAADARGEVAIPYLQAEDAQGIPVYEEREFEAPQVQAAGAAPAPAAPAQPDGQDGDGAVMGNLRAVTSLNSDHVMLGGQAVNIGRMTPNTTAFRNWFGDSKVVDKDGKPLVVYHGTQTDFTVFRPGATPSNDGIFFTKDPDIASAVYANGGAGIQLDNVRKALDAMGFAGNESDEDQFEQAHQLARAIRKRNRYFEGDPEYDAGSITDQIVQYLENTVLDGREDIARAVAEHLDVSVGAVAEGANVRPVFLSLQNPLLVDGSGKSFDDDEQEGWIAQAKEGGYDGIIIRNYEDGGFGGIENYRPASRHTVYIAFSPEQVKSAIGNNGAFDPANPDILGAQRTTPATVFDQALHDAINTGTTAQDLLERIATESTSPDHRALARQLLANGVNPSVGTGSADGQTFNTGRDTRDYAASYDPKAHHVALYEANGAERNLLHEFTHAATAKALRVGGRAAMQMKALYAAAKRSSKLAGMYGMANVDEFVAEAHSNPAFQQALRQTQTGPRNLWERFVDIVRAIIGLPPGQRDMLTTVLQVGSDLMTENSEQADEDGAETGGALGSARARPWERAAQLDWERGTENTMAAALPDGSTLYLLADDEGVTLNHFDESGDELRTEQSYASIDEAKAAAQKEYDRLFATGGMGNLAQTVTKVFRDWFGDSKVVNARGEPLVVYHGTPEDFTDFDVGSGPAWFSEEEGYAQEYAANGAEWDDEAEGGRTVPAYVAIERPLMIAEDLEDSPDAIAGTLAALGLPAEDYMGYDFAWRVLDQPKVIEAIKAAGHDGIRAVERGVSVWAAFRPGQIKSATANSGAFDPANPSIMGNIAANDPIAAANNSPLTQAARRRFDQVMAEAENWLQSNGKTASLLDLEPRWAMDSLDMLMGFGSGNLSEKAKEQGRAIWTRADAAYKQLARRGGELEGGDAAIMGNVRESLDAALASTADRIKAVELPAGYLVGDLLDRTGKVGWWHKTIGTMDNLARRHPAFGTVYRAVQQFLGDVSRYAMSAAEQAPRLLPQLENLRDVVGSNRKQAVSAADTKAIAAPIFEGTLVWTRDDRGRPVKVDDLAEAAKALSTEDKAQVLVAQRVIDASTREAWRKLPADSYAAAVETRYAATQLQGGIVWTDGELRSMFNLDDAQISLYREFRAAVDKSITNLTISEMVKMGGKPAKGLMGRAVEAPNLSSAARLLRDHYIALAQMHPELAAGYTATAQQIMNLADKGHNLMNRGYAPLTRFGRYTVYMTEEGQEPAFLMFEDAADAAKKARELREQFPDAFVRQGTMSEEEYKLFAGVSPETIELFGSMLGLGGEANAQDAAYQEFLRLTKANRSALKRLIHRKGVAGYSEDAGRVLASFLYSNARLTSANVHSGEIDEAVTAIPKEQGQLKDEAMALRQHIRDPQGGGTVLSGMMFAQFLGGSVASAMVNLTQPVTMTLPYLSQYGGLTKAGKRLKAAMLEAAKKEVNDADLAQALKEGEAVIAPQEVHFMQAQAAGKSTLQAGDGTRMGDARAKAHNALAAVRLGWGKFFAMAELSNRKITFIAAWRTAREEGLPNATAFAIEAVNRTQMVYNQGNRPRWARNPVGGLLLTFKQYSVGYLELLSQMAFAGKPGSPERKAGQRAALYMLAVLFMMGGADGLPFEQDLEDAIDGLLQRMGYNFSSKRAKQAFLAEQLGEGGADFVLKGVSSLPGMPVDVAGRFGMGNLIPGTGLLTKKESYTRDLGELAGPAGDLARRAFTGAGKALGGDVLGAALDLSPVAVRNLAQGADMLATGTYRDARGYRVNDTTPVEGVMKAIGFQPNSTANVQEAKGQALNMLAQARMRSGEISEHWAQGRANGDEETVNEARAMRDDWNAKNPDTPVKISMPGVLRRAKAMREDALGRTQKTAGKALKAAVRRELAEVRD
jgi:N12 class adenine-specific DNA methylase